MFPRARRFPLLLITAGALLFGACQSPTSPSDSVAVNEFVDVGVAPDPIVAGASTDGKTYRVTENDTTVTRPYPWKARFDTVVVLNEKANDRTLDLEWPVTITAATFQPQQATGGIRVQPPAGEIEHWTSEIASATSNRFDAASTSRVLTIDVWYDFPNRRQEALVLGSVSFRDNKGRTFTRTEEFRIAP